jgi:hypothetical protein
MSDDNLHAALDNLQKEVQLAKEKIELKKEMKRLREEREEKERLQDESSFAKLQQMNRCTTLSRRWSNETRTKSARARSLGWRNCVKKRSCRSMKAC